MPLNRSQKLVRRSLGAALALALALTPPIQANAEDIDLFVSAAATSATNPNILIILDNSANWNSNAQHWPDGKQGESELRAIKSVIGELDGDKPQVNIGLMMFRDGSPDSGFLRYAIREMNTANLKGLIELVGDESGCSGNNSVNGTPNCILQNFSGTGVEQTNSASTDYSAALFDAFKYFGGFTSPAYAVLDKQPPSAVNDSTHFGQAVYWGTDKNERTDKAAYTTDEFTTYQDPIASPCAKNYIIFIGNGFPSQDGGSIIQNVNNGATPTLPTQLAVPNFTTIVSQVQETIGTNSSCISSTECATAAAAAAPGLYDSYSCTGGTVVGTTTTIGNDSTCETNSACVSRASLTAGFSSYSCTGGTSVSPPASTLGTDSVCETASACATRAAALFPGHVSYQCTGGSSPVGVNLGTDGNCEKVSDCVSRAQGIFGSAYGNYSCSGGTTCGGQKRQNQTYQGTCSGPSAISQTMQSFDVAACISPNRIDQTMQGTNSCIQNQTMIGTKAVSTVTPLTTFSVPSKTNYADEWARFLYTTDVSSRPGQQNVAVYTIDVFKDHQDADETALLFNMAKYGGGKYFQATNEAAIINALRQILIEIQSVNTVFASASLPINATNRSQNENQVFIGMFRPDGAANPRWYGNLKRYQIADFGGGNFKLGDASTPPLDAVSTSTGFVQPCAKSFWTVDSGDYWLFQNGSAGQCTSSGLSLFSDAPDGPAVEKGAVAEVLRRGNNPPTTPGAQDPLPSVSRTIYTCMDSTSCCTAPASCGSSPATELVQFNNTNVSKTQLGSAAMSDLERDNIINFTIGTDLFDQNTNANAADIRPSIHGDVAHSRPLPVNYGTPNGVVLFYGANDGTFRAVSGSDGKELWAFIAPEHHAKLKRLADNAPPILYPNQDPVPVGAKAKDYFFDGSAGLFQNADNTKVWVFPTMRRGGRMLYAFDVTDPTAPALKWRVGCSNADMADTSSCTTGFEQMGETWSIPAPALIKGFSTDVNTPVIVMGGGYDSCDDEDAAPNTQCGASRRGNRVYIINANTGALVKAFATNGSVPSDVTLVDRDFDGFADHAYATTTTGYIYRIDFVDPTNVSATRASSEWTINEVAHTDSTGNRKFLFGPAVLPSSGKMFVSVASGDRERPLIVNYPYVTPVTNRAYMVVDSFNVTTDPTTGTVTGTSVNLDDTDQMEDLTSGSDCSTATPTASGKNGWFFELNNGTGEQAVTSSTIFAGLVFFSTNRPIPTPSGACSNELGEARGYAVNLLNASGAVGTQAICGADRSGVFVGGGLPPSPVTGTVPVNGRPITVMIGGIDRSGGVSSPIGAQRVKPTITQKRSRLYIYNKGEE